MMMTENRFIWC